MTESVGRPEMTAEDVCDFLDIVIEERHVALVTTDLERRGYAPIPRPDTRAWNFVFGDAVGRQIDFHVIVLEEGGRGRYGPAWTKDYCPAKALTGSGTVNGRTVDCITPEWLVRFHTGYEVDTTDWADVSALCQRFGIPLPSEYSRFTR